jgi:hypothetical protein
MMDRIVEVFCEVDDFCQAFVPQWEASLIGTGGPGEFSKTGGNDEGLTGASN